MSATVEKRRGSIPPPSPLQIAPSAPIAEAARRYGDRYPASRRQWPIRAVGLGLVALMVFYLVWMFGHLATQLPWLCWPFAAASVFSAGCLLLSIVNSWTSRVEPQRPLEGDDVPLVAVLIPTCGEPVPMIVRTIIGVQEQDYPADRRLILVSDDGHDPALRDACAELGVDYCEPPDRWAPGRDGAAKSGNLNFAFAVIDARHPDVQYIETRDADDEVGSRRFLRQTIGQLEHDPGLAYVQTVKETQVSDGDPFVNFDSQFYRGQMLYRNARNTVFPCGSGLVWRREALEDIGRFPTWNLVEDLQSGVEALRRGWRSCYLPIVGAVGQHSPEDVPNVVKQRGTWAIDTVRLFVWGRWAGLSVRQRLSFAETLGFYLHSFTALVYVPVTALACLRVAPVNAPALACLIHLTPYAIIAEARLLLLNRPFGDRRGRQRRPLRALWRLKVMWLGLSPIYIFAALKAILGGPRRKPVYKVTRKTTEFGVYWRETLPGLLLGAIVPVALVIGVLTHHLPHPVILISAGYWGLIAVVALLDFALLGWFGRHRVVRRYRSPTAVDRRRPRILRLRSPAHAVPADVLTAPDPAG